MVPRALSQTQPQLGFLVVLLLLTLCRCFCGSDDHLCTLPAPQELRSFGVRTVMLSPFAVSCLLTYSYVDTTSSGVGEHLVNFLFTVSSPEWFERKLLTPISLGWVPINALRLMCNA